MSRRLTQNINFPITLRVLGLLLVIEAAFMSLPLAVALFYGESSTAWAFFYTTLATVGVGALMTFGIKPKSSSMRKREGLILTASIWVIFSLFGMIPFLITGTLCNPVDAFFETMAGFTTTGSSAIIDLEVLSHGLLFWRALMQWIGGMGIILFTLAVLPMLNYKGGIALFNAEVTGITHERLRPRVSQTAKDLWLIYIVLTLLLTLTSLRMSLKRNILSSTVTTTMLRRTLCVVVFLTRVSVSMVVRLLTSVLSGVRLLHFQDLTALLSSLVVRHRLSVLVHSELNLMRSLLMVLSSVTTCASSSTITSHHSQQVRLRHSAA